MLSNRDAIVEVLDRLDAATDAAAGLSFDVLTTQELLRVMERLERVARKLPVSQHAVINRLAEQATETELAAGCPMRWPIGCASPAPTPNEEWPKRPISAGGAH
jgi:hypothetical protein